MSTIRISAFGGIIPAIDDRALPDNNAALAQNCYLYSGAVRGFNELEAVYNLAVPSSANILRIPNNFLDAEHLPDATFVEFAVQYVDVIRTAVVGDTFERYYWASPTDQPRYNTKARIQAGNTGANKPFLLGIPQPVYSPVLTVVGGSGTVVTRSYVITYVSAYGEEGPPSNPVTVSGFANGSWNMTLTPYSDPDRNITKVRIYRTVTSSQGVATYFRVAEVVMATTTYNDTAADVTITVNPQLTSQTWFGPPSNLEGWVSMPNGIVAGWRGKEVWFCEPYRPHAWPSEYTIATEYDVVGLGVYGQTLIVCTQGFPTAITGINPGSMTMAKVSTFEPCLSRGSIVSAPEGVYYASPNGLILAAQGQFQNITKNAITKDKWQDLTKVATLRAVHFGSGYMGYGGVRFGCFNTSAFNQNAFEKDDYTGAYQGILVDPANPNAWATLYSSVPITNIQSDPWSGEAMIIKGGKVYWLDMQSLAKPRAPYKWKSKVFQSNVKENFEAVKVYFNIAPGTTANPVGSPNNALVQTYNPASQYGLIRIYADGDLIATRELRTPGEQFRLPSGFKCEFWQIEFEGVVDITNVQMATTAKELRSV